MGANGKMSMRLFIGGMRGSRPCAGSAFEEFGGDTTSLLLVGARGERIVLDAGTGMLAVAGQLAKMEPGEVTILFSHYHLDHIVGLMMNPLLHDSRWSFTLAGPTFTDGGVREVVTQLLRPPYWPISCEQMAARIQFVDFTADHMQVGTLGIRKCPIPHPGVCVAYRIDSTDNNLSLVFATDIEWRGRTDMHEKSFMKLCCEPQPADMLIIDAHFTRADVDAFAGWGHTCWEDALDIAASAKVKRTLLAHHAPEADDETLRAREQQVKKRFPGGEFARAGQWLEIERR
jgi:ribonuclease BN (tRNA processing enzyme)